MRATCACGCGRTFSRAETGRPRLYHSDRCKKREERKRRKLDDANAVANLATVQVDESGDGQLCHICGQALATRGYPTPMICAGCGDKGVAA